MHVEAKLNRFKGGPRDALSSNELQGAINNGRCSREIIFSVNCFLLSHCPLHMILSLVLSAIFSEMEKKLPLHQRANYIDTREATTTTTTTTSKHILSAAKNLYTEKKRNEKTKKVY